MLTVIVPNYNHARYLPQSLGAILAQTPPPDEVIVIDDCSTDDSIAVITALIADHPQARLVRNESNRGCLVSMNEGLELARGDIIHFAAADDEVLPGLYAQSQALLERYPQAGLCSTISLIMDADGRHLPPLPAPQPLAVPGFIPPDRARRLLMRDDSWFMGNTTLYRTAVLRRLGGFPTELGAYSDSIVSRRISLEFGACFHPSALGVWRRIPNGMAWESTMSCARLDHDIALGVKTMAAIPCFPADYPRRWAHRIRFGAARFALGQRMRRHKTGGLVLRAVELAGAALLFLRYRPEDLPVVFLRRLRHALASLVGPVAERSERA